MGNLTWKMRALSAAVGFTVTLGWVSVAEAAISRKIWDPAYGAALPDLGWSGSVDFNIQDSCLDTIATSQWISNLAFGSSCFNKLSIESADVTLYDLNNPASNVLLSYDGGSTLGGGDNVNVALRMYVEVSGTEKTLKAVQGGFLFPEFTNASFAKVAGYDAAAYWLNFNANTTNNFTGSGAPQGDYAFLSSCSFDYPHNPGEYEKYDTYKTKYSDVSCSQNDGVNNPAILRPIPEPETYLLGLASFGVLGVWARRRRRVSLAS